MAVSTAWIPLPQSTGEADRLIASAGSKVNDGQGEAEGSSIQRSTRNQVFYGRVRRKYTKKRKAD